MNPAQPNEVDGYILDLIRVGVWSGFYTPEEVHGIIDDVLEEGATEEMLRAAVEPEFEKKSAAEKSWPAVTDCDRLTAAFDRLNARNVLCLPNAGHTMSDGHVDAYEALSNRPGHSYFGYCFYHGQDLEQAVKGQGLMLAYDHVEGDVPDKLLVGLAIKEEMECAGFSVEWDGKTSSRINLPFIDWKQRYKKVVSGAPAAADSPVMPASKTPSFWKRLCLRLLPRG